ncbi:OsmC family protein [Reichenbachiella carrageenanivorans]|uniref:OsmC family protein n=1 Tax=Reichenbachiella carrageenanivorans TaxID=2979869 RepID=A0ABY6D299_9BACT|nr:OsmC family protein [Reichenbachiella carrageenanivorans]UXX80290.1 OsmC family protein [Reichenbachiella carrageenanivorans]
MSMTSTLHYKADNEFEATNQAGNTVSMDMYPQAEKKDQSPMDLVLSAVAGCAAVDIVSMIKKKRKTFVDLKSETTAERAETFPKKFTKIHIKYIITSPDLTEKEAEKVIDLAVNNYCSVASSLHPDITLTHSFEIVR